MGLRQGNALPQGSTGRREFVAALETSMQSFLEHDVLELSKLRTPDLFFTKVDAVIIEVASKFFEKKVAAGDPELEQLRSLRLLLLVERRNLRDEILKASDVEALHL